MTCSGFRTQQKGTTRAWSSHSQDLVKLFLCCTQLGQPATLSRLHFLDLLCEHRLLLSKFCRDSGTFLLLLFPPRLLLCCPPCTFFFLSLSLLLFQCFSPFICICAELIHDRLCCLLFLAQNGFNVLGLFFLLFLILLLLLLLFIFLLFLFFWLCMCFTLLFLLLRLF